MNKTPQEYFGVSDDFFNKINYKFRDAFLEEASIGGGDKVNSVNVINKTLEGVIDTQERNFAFFTCGYHFANLKNSKSI